MTKWLKDSWKFASVKLAAAVAAVTAALTANPDLVLGIIAMMPGDPLHRAVLAVVVGLLTFLGPTIVRMWPQTDA